MAIQYTPALALPYPEVRDAPLIASRDLRALAQKMDSEGAQMRGQTIEALTQSEQALIEALRAVQRAELIADPVHVGPDEPTDGEALWVDTDAEPTPNPVEAAWDDVTGKPATFPPSAHTHDDRYYTQTEVDQLIADHPLLYDSGRLDIRSDLVNSDQVTSAGRAWLQRTGNRVHLSLYDVAFSSSGTVRLLTDLPHGYRPIAREGYTLSISSDTNVEAIVMSTGLYLYSVPTGGGRVRATISWSTENPQPTT